MTRSTWMLLAGCALAACGTGKGDEARPAAPEARRVAETAADRAAADPFAFVLHRTPEGVVDSVVVTRGGRRVQTLEASEPFEGAPLDDPTYRIDLDFDGHVDFALVTLVPAAPNPAYDYWRFDPASGRFRYVGNYEMFSPDSAARELHTHARGGHAGRTWSNSRWRWVNGAIVEVWRGEQTWAEEAQRYVYVQSELRGGRMVQVSADTVPPEEMEPEDAPADPPAPSDS